MRVALIGRTEALLEAGERLRRSGHDIALVVTAREAPEYAATAADFERAAAGWGAAFVHTARIREVEPLLAALPPIDLGISINYPGVIPESTIRCFALGILNAHGGDLPRYRGNACQQWALLMGETRIGLCVHKMVGGELDSGDIIARDYYPVALTTTIGDVHDWMMARIPALFACAADALAADPAFVLERQSTDWRDALRCYPRRPEDARIDWRADATAVVRLINASGRPYAGAFTECEATRVVVQCAEVAPPEMFLAVAGQGTALHDDWVEVACASGKVRLRELSVEGVPVMPRALIRSLRQRFS